MSINTRSKLHKKAVVLFNLGGPDSLETVEPFLFNLFHDHNIIPLTWPLRFFVAKLISKLRRKSAIKNYKMIGGKSPLLENTLLQAEALQQSLGDEFTIFVAMNFWHPMPREVLIDVMKHRATEIILIPLFPQFSTTTTGAFLEEWNEQKKRLRCKLPQKVVCCYYDSNDFLSAFADLIIKEYNKFVNKDNILLIFTAHGLPKKVIDNGDPYQFQITQGVQKIVDILKSKIDNLSHVLSYQSRVGPMQWIKPYTDETILEASIAKKDIIVIPIAFVSEHIETLLELDIEYKELAMKNGANSYTRISTLGTNKQFIDGLKKLVLSPENSKKCPAECKKCFRANK